MQVAVRYRASQKRYRHLGLIRNTLNRRLLNLNKQYPDIDIVRMLEIGIILVSTNHVLEEQFLQFFEKEYGKRLTKKRKWH